MRKKNSKRQTGAAATMVEIVVCAHNALSDVRACLESIVRTHDQPAGLIVVDDASEAETRTYLESFVQAHDSCTLIRNEERLGYTRSANRGLQATTAEFVVLLNSDTVVTPRWLERLLECAQSDPAIGIAGPLSNAASWQSVPEVVGESGDWATNALPSDWGPDRLADLVAEVSQRQFPRVPFVNGFCLLIRRAVIDKIGLFDEERFPDGYGEENDYCLRAAEAGFQLAIADHAYVYHAKSRSYSHERRRELSQSGHRALRQRHRPRTIDEGVTALKENATLMAIRQQVAEAIRQAEESEPPTWDTSLSVLFVLPAPGGTGGTHSIVQEARGLRELGVHAEVAVDAKFHTRFMENYGDEPGMRRLSYFYSTPQELVVHAAEFDVIIATVDSSMALVRLIAGVFPAKLPAYYVQDYEPYFFEPGSSQWQAARESYTLVPGAVLFAKTRWVADIVRREHGIDVHQVEPSLDQELFYPAPDGTRPAGTPVSVAAMIRPSTPRRAPHRTMAVLKGLQEAVGADVDVHLFGCTDGELEGTGLDLSFRFANHGVLSRIQVADLLRATDVFIDLSDYQAFGRTGLEAMACGCAVVVPAKGGAGEYAVDGVNALVVETADEKACVAAARSLVVDRDLRSSLRSAALQTACGFSIRGAATSEARLFSEMRLLRAQEQPQTEKAAAGHEQMAERIRAVAAQALPPNATVLVLGTGDETLPRLSDQRGWHVPHDDSIGRPPVDSAAAIAQVEAARADGSEYLLIPRTAFWWLEQYDDFRRHLEERHRGIALDPESCLIFDLERPPAVAIEIEAQRSAVPYWDLVQTIRSTAEESLPEDSIVLVVSKGDYDLVRLNGRRAWHFPQTADGSYAGFHPADSAAAIAHLEELRAKGAEYLLLPRTSFWWLDHYSGLRRYLEERYHALPLSGDACLIYALGPVPALAASPNGRHAELPMPTQQTPVPTRSNGRDAAFIPGSTETMVAQVEAVNLTSLTDSATAGLDSNITGIVIRGWLHLPGASDSQYALLFVDEEFIGSAPATLYRADLVRQGKSDGWCGFEYALPPEVVDDREHTLSVRLEPNGRVLASRKFKIQPLEKPYTDLEDFSSWAYFHRISHAPFTEADKRVLSFFDWKRRYLRAHFEARAPEDLPLVSVILPTYNRAAALERAILSVLEQTYPNLEFVVVDDGSTDLTVDIVKTFHDERLKLLVLGQNHGVSHARNVGMEQASGELFAYLDSDNWWDPDHLAAMFEALAGAPEHDAAYCGQFLYKTGSAQPFAYRTGPFNRQLLDNRNYIDLNCYLHRRSLYEAHGGFDTELRKLVDWDLVLRYSAEAAPLFVEVITSHYAYNTDGVTLTQAAGAIDFAGDILRKNVAEVLTLDMPSLGIQSATRDQEVLELPIPKAPALTRRRAGTSIIIPSFNIPGVLTVCVERLVASLKHHSYEIIIVDNGSDPDHLPQIEALGRRFAHVKTTYLRANHGFTEAVNAGLSLANPDWDVVLHNNDAIVTPGWLDAMREAVEVVPDAGIVGPQQILLPHERTIRSHNPFAATDRFAEVNVSMHHGNYRRVLDRNGFFVEVNFIPFFCALITRDVLREVSSLDVELGRHYRSDRNYCNVVRNHLGRPIVVALRSKVFHLLQRSTDSLRTREKDQLADLFVGNRLNGRAPVPFWV